MAGFLRAGGRSLKPSIAAQIAARYVTISPSLPVSDRGFEVGKWMLSCSRLLHTQEGYLRARIIHHEAMAPHLHPLRLVKDTTHLAGLGETFSKVAS